ncbi:MAG: prepilin-type N-terminal cleavage/methylation domain-containing protein [Candidatus Gottesmanbacteria bacterium]|nr:prepilin-type N-terminal cleavage/methylation domain-containing protein [Candidatus Gottesmanbacteria bacterium]
MKKQRGFTIAELLIYMGLLTILMTILTRLFTATIDVQLSSEATGGVEEDSRYIYSRLAYDLARADSIVTPESPGSRSTTLTIMIGSETYSYRVSGTNLILVNDTGEGALNSYMTGISNVTFTSLGSDTGKKSIQVTYTITSTIQSSSGTVMRNIETTITQR